MDDISNPKWVKQIKPDSSIQTILTGKFTHPTISDCILVGHSSIRLLSIKSNKLVETTTYMHKDPISSATVFEKFAEIIFISKNELFFLSLNKDHELAVTHKQKIDQEYTFVTCWDSKILLYSTYPTISIADREALLFTRYDINVQSVLSAGIINNRIVLLQRANNFEVCFYNYSDPAQLKSVYRKVLSMEIPYRLICTPAHNAVYVLSQGKFSKIQMSENSYFFNPFQISSKNGDDLIVDAVSVGINLYMLNADGLVIRFDGEKVEIMKTIIGANSISSPTLNRLLISIDSDKIQLLDRDLSVLDEVESVICRSSSYRKGNFIIASGHSVHSAFYDYGIEIEKVSEMKYVKPPHLKTSNGNYTFVMYEDRAVVISEDFKDCTPSVLKHNHFERIHMNSLQFFFAVCDDSIHVFDHGYVNVIKHKSTLSCFHHSTIFLALGSYIGCYMYSNGVLEKVSDRKFVSQVSAIETYNSTNVLIALFDGSVFIADDDLNVKEGYTFEDCFVTSFLESTNKIVCGLSNGQVVVFTCTLSVINKYTVGILPAFVCGNETIIGCKCGKKFYAIIDDKPNILPPDFLSFDVLPNGKCIAIVSSPKKTVSAALFTFHFTDANIGFHSRTLFEFNGYIDRVCSTRTKDAFVCSIREPASLFWSRGEVITPLETREVVRTICEWKANHGGKFINFWAIVTEGSMSVARFLLYMQSSSDYKVRSILAKVFQDPITSFCIVSPELAVFTHPDQVVGISLESGSLRKVFSNKALLPDIVFSDASTDYIGCITNNRGFFVMKVVKNSLSSSFVLKKPMLGSRIKIVDKYVVVSDRFGLLEIYSVEGKFIKRHHFVSSVTEMFNIGSDKVLCCHICGELTIIKVTDGEVLESDVSSLFSFGRSAFANWSEL